MAGFGVGSGCPQLAQFRVLFAHMLSIPRLRLWQSTPSMASLGSALVSQCTVGTSWVASRQLPSFRLHLPFASSLLTSSLACPVSSVNFPVHSKHPLGRECPACAGATNTVPARGNPWHSDAWRSNVHSPPLPFFRVTDLAHARRNPKTPDQVRRNLRPPSPPTLEATTSDAGAEALLHWAAVHLRRAPRAPRVLNHRPQEHAPRADAPRDAHAAGAGVLAEPPARLHVLLLERLPRRPVRAAGTPGGQRAPVSYTHLTLPTTPYV